MLNPTKFFFYSLYSYYHENRGQTEMGSYIGAIGTFFVTIFLNFFILLGMLGIKGRYVMPFSLSDPTWMQYVKAIVLVAAPGCWLTSLLFRKSTVVNSRYNQQLVEKGKFIALAYVVCSFLVSVLVAKW